MGVKNKLYIAYIVFTKELFCTVKRLLLNIKGENRSVLAYGF